MFREKLVQKMRDVGVTHGILCFFAECTEMNSCGISDSQKADDEKRGGKRSRTRERGQQPSQAKGAAYQAGRPRLPDAVSMEVKMK